MSKRDELVVLLSLCGAELTRTRGHQHVWVLPDGSRFFLPQTPHARTWANKLAELRRRLRRMS